MSHHTLTLCLPLNMKTINHDEYIRLKTNQLSAVMEQVKQAFQKAQGWHTCPHVIQVSCSSFLLQHCRDNTNGLATHHIYCCFVVSWTNDLL